MAGKVGPIVVLDWIDFSNEKKMLKLIIDYNLNYIFAYILLLIDNKIKKYIATSLQYTASETAMLVTFLFEHYEWAALVNSFVDIISLPIESIMVHSIVRRIKISLEIYLKKYGNV